MLPSGDCHVSWELAESTRRPKNKQNWIICGQEYVNNIRSTTRTRGDSDWSFSRSTNKFPDPNTVTFYLSRKPIIHMVFTGKGTSQSMFLNDQLKLVKFFNTMVLYWKCCIPTIHVRPWICSRPSTWTFLCLATARVANKAPASFKTTENFKTWTSAATTHELNLITVAVGLRRRSGFDSSIFKYDGNFKGANLIWPRA